MGSATARSATARSATPRSAIGGCTVAWSTVVRATVARAAGSTTARPAISWLCFENFVAFHDLLHLLKPSFAQGGRNQRHRGRALGLAKVSQLETRAGN